MDALGFIESIRSSRGYRGQIVCARLLPSRNPEFGDVDPGVSGEIGRALERLGIKRFYSHQAAAINAVRKSRSVVVVTSTASGKTLCYNVPVIEALERDHQARAIYIYPTKALAQDQLGKLRQFEIESIRAATYDGDTPRQERPFIKSSANIVLTNSDMLHLGILPYHTTWSDLFRNLKYVVIDEVHTYRGVFGSHVACVMRRLRRIAEHYGSSPTFVCASATVTNPGSLVEDLTGVEPLVIDNDGSPAGDKLFVFWNPPYLAAKGERRSANSEAVDLFTRLTESDIRAIVFTKARKTAELILRYAREELRERSPERVEKIMSYRAGYKPAERREIERRLFSGGLLGVTSTTALEVGVDIGGLDAVVMIGYPGTVASAWQQAGRAGRGVRQSMAVLVARDDPIDQFIMRDPDYFFKADHERAIVDHSNPYVLADHLLCAAYELPLENEEVQTLFGDPAFEVLGILDEIGQVSYRKRWFWSGHDFPAAKVNIRSASGENYSIVSVEGGGSLIGTVDGASAFDTVHSGAVYLHAGESYVVTRLDTLDRVAYVEKSEVDYYTTPGDRTRVSVDDECQSARLGDITIHFGDVTVANQVTHFWRKKLMTDQVISRVDLDLPETSLATQSMWFSLPADLTNKLIGRGFDLEGTIHAIEHASIGILPLFAMCDRNDIGGVSHPSHPDTSGLASVFIYDGYSGGVGLSRVAFEQAELLLEATLKAIRDCGCDEGCPSCIQSPKCGNNNQPLDKAGAVYILEAVLAGLGPA